MVPFTYIITINKWIPAIGDNIITHVYSCYEHFYAAIKIRYYSKYNNLNSSPTGCGRPRATNRYITYVGIKYTKSNQKCLRSILFR